MTNPIRPGQLVLDPAGYYAIVLEVTHGAARLFLGGGIQTIEDARACTPLGLKHTPQPAPADYPPALFREIINLDR